MISITATVRLRVPPQKQQNALEVLRFVMEDIRRLSGCLDCRISRDLEHEDEIFFQEIWRSQKDLEQHLQSERFRYILEAMELASRPPEVSFHTATLLGGMEMLRAVREA
jgi:quinol monooxygenase YgiN